PSDCNGRPVACVWLIKDGAASGQGWSAIFHIVLLTIVITLCVLAWLLVNSAPRVLSLILPARLTFILGATLFTMGLFAAFSAPLALGGSCLILGCFIQSFVGLWLIFAGSAGLRGDPDYDEVTRKVGIMLGLLVAVIVAVFYFPNVHAVAILNLGLVTA